MVIRIVQFTVGGRPGLLGRAVIKLVATVYKVEIAAVQILFHPLAVKNVLAKKNDIKPVTLPVLLMEVGHRGQYGLLATNRVVMATMFEQELALTHCPCMVAAFVKECQKKKHHVGALPAQK